MILWKLHPSYTLVIPRLHPGHTLVIPRNRGGPWNITFLLILHTTRISILRLRVLWGCVRTATISDAFVAPSYWWPGGCICSGWIAFIETHCANVCACMPPGGGTTSVTGVEGLVYTLTKCKPVVLVVNRSSGEQFTPDEMNVFSTNTALGLFFKKTDTCRD